MTLRKVDLDRVVALSGLIAAAVALTGLVAGVGDAPSVLVGAAIMITNLYLIRMLVSLLIAPGRSRAVRTWGLVLLTLKLLLALLLVAAVVYRFPIAPLSFAVGATTLLAAIVLEGVALGLPVGNGARNDASNSKS